jgi:regulation of enolase protein 1 (concanavalin A-like superfamily)
LLKTLRRGGALPIVILCVLAASVRDSAAQSLPSGWSSVSVGASSGSSSANSSGTFTVSGTGANVWGTADAFQFAYRSVSGDVDITARISSFATANDWSRAGLMMRASLNPDAQNAYLLTSPRIGLALQTRVATGGSTARTTSGAGDAPIWVRLVRRGSQFISYRSSDGQSWTNVASVSIETGSTIYVGLAVTSRHPSIPANATFDNVSVTASGSQTAQPTWANRDIGNPLLSGSYTLSGGTFSVVGGGRDIWERADEFHFVYQPFAGDVEVIARLASLTGIERWAKAGVMIRSSLTSESAHGLMLGSGGHGWAFQRRLASGGDSYSDQGPDGAPPGWVRLVREGSLLSAYASSDGSRWTLVGTDSISIGSTAYVGLAVTSHSSDSTATGSFTNVIIRAPSSGTNQPPVVTLTAPAGGATYTAPATISMTASANDPDGSIARVDFYSGSTLVGSDTTSPYTASWGSAPAGTHSLRAVATDSEGATASSSTVSVTVNTSSNQAPAVAITSPAQGSTFTAPATITIAASASDPDGTVARVDFYRDSTLIESDTSSPYSVTWTGVAAATYSLTAMAYDNAGATRTSAAVSVSVGSSQNQLPTVAITSPASGTSYVAPASMTILATAADADGTIARVEFYAGSQLIATDTSSPYSAPWGSVPAGNYTLTALARDNAGGTRTSVGVAITVGSSATAPPPTTLQFNASADHSTNVTSYVVAIYRSVDPVTASPVATRDLGKPTPVSGVISVDISTLVNPLPAGSYYAVVRATNSSGSSSSAPSAPFSK